MEQSELKNLDLIINILQKAHNSASIKVGYDRTILRDEVKKRGNNMTPEYFEFYVDYLKH